MTTQKGFLIDTLFYLVIMSTFDGFSHRKFLLVAASFLVSVSSLFFALFGFFNFRFKWNERQQTNNSNCLQFDSNCIEQETEAEQILNCTEQEAEFEKPQRISDCIEQEAEDKEPKFDATEFNHKRENEDLEEEEAPKFIFKFQYQTYREDCEPIVSDSVPSTTTSKYDFFSMKDASLFVEKPEVLSLKVEELYADSNDGSIGNKEIKNFKILSDKKFVEQEREEYSVDSAAKGDLKEKLGAEPCFDGSNSSNKVSSDRQVSTKDVQFQSERDFIAPDFDSDSDSDSDSITSSHEFVSRFAASTSDNFLSDKDIEDVFELINLRETEEESMEFEDMNLEKLSNGYEPDNVDEEDSEILEEVKNLEESNVQNSESNEEGSSGSKDTEGEDSNGLEILWEHQELIEQLKMELKKVRATGLPTILEDDESPKIMEDLKPWKIEDKFHHEDRMSELYKFYKSYRERMRKFDILNYQKMYAMGFLQSKDPLEAISSSKGSAPALTSLLWQKMLAGKRKKSGMDPTMSFIRELHGDLEMVYVGQMCLSWEILHWQYQKALEIWDSDPYRIRRYNEVAGEFQQFQVLMQRFIENEPFEGPRVQNYVKNRCILRNLLQVPLIREDNMKDKKARRNINDNGDAIRSDTLVEIMEESIRIFWRFVRADKDSHNAIQRSRKGTQIQPQDSSELELLTEVRSSLQKKEKKLKDVLRSGSCILKKFQKQKEESGSDQVLFFFSQVDMKLVARVLNMSKITTDQLLWCRSKLEKINFVRRKIHVDPSFLLFPC